MRKVLKGKYVKYAVAAAMVVSMLMTTACNSKIKVDYGYSPTDYVELGNYKGIVCLLYTSPSPRDSTSSRMPSSA